MSKAEVIVLEQLPVIKYDLVKKIGADVQASIDALNLDDMEASESNLSLLKSTRSSLTKEFKTFEEQRMLVKDIIMKPYNDFDALYKEHIVKVFGSADTILKAKVDGVDHGILTAKIEELKEYFSFVNLHDFLKFEDLGLKIIKSRTNKSIQEEIDTFIDRVTTDLITIDTLPNKERVEVKYHIYKDLNRAISETNIEVQREAAIASVREPVVEVKPRAAEPVQEVDNQQYRASFTVTATKQQIRELKEFMKQKGINYEPRQ